MVAINLLPWREQQQRYQQARFLKFFLAGIFILTLSFSFIYLTYNRLIEKLKTVNALKLEQIKLNEKHLPKSTAPNLLTKLAEEHNKTLNLFLILKEMSPDITVNEIRRLSGNFSIHGHARNLQPLNEFLRVSQWQLTEVQAKDQYWNFKLKVKNYGLTNKK